ncbi:MAG: hypothetical protein JWO11_2585 [Nocardioides sp.]|nr:hypothetical protein [Nocardioides sp.]
MPESENGPQEPAEGSAHADGEPATRAQQRAAAAARMEQQQTWVDLQVRQAMARGDFDDLPGQGKPIADLGTAHDPDWWLKRLVERERIAVLPPSVQLRKEDGGLDERLAGLGSEREVRREIEDFNERVIAARYRLPEGPPLITMPRDVEETVATWRASRATRRPAADARRAQDQKDQNPQQRRRFLRRCRG